ncbi:hypothetical protein ABES02_29160 [Neobacillus pocheonensis]|uniref:hypothetical protein n=1 Tax=Neobacillus pocheonensis TaxID=363869 RepID=UPI003D2BC99D
MGPVKTYRTMMEPLIKSLEMDVEEQLQRIANYPEGEAPKYMTEDLERITERLVFIREQWADAEKRGSLDEPIYEQGSIEYYRHSFEKQRIERLDIIAIQDIQFVLENNDLKPNQKIKRLNNLMKVYKEFKERNS